MTRSRTPVSKKVANRDGLQAAQCRSAGKAGAALDGPLASELLTRVGSATPHERTTMDHSATQRRLYDLLNAGDIEGFGALLAEGFVEHEETPGLAPTKEGVLEFFRMYRAAFPDLRMDPEDWPAATRSSRA